MQVSKRKMVIGLTDGCIRIFDRQSLETIKSWTAHKEMVSCLQMDDRVIVSGSADETVKIWNANTGLLISTVKYHTNGITALRLKGNTLITASRDKSLVVWTLDINFKVKKSFVKMDRHWWISSVDFDEKYIVAGSSAKKQLRLFDTKNGEELRVLEGHTLGVSCLSYENGMLISGSYDNTIRIWDIEQGKCVRVLEGHEKTIRSIRLCGRRIISGCWSGKTKIWNLKNALEGKEKEKACIQTIHKHTDWRN